MTTKVHGFTSIAFEDYRIPAWIWKRLTVCVETGCWEYNGDASVRPHRMMAMRLLNIEYANIHAITQTCANKKCANPAHLCVVLKT